MRKDYIMFGYFKFTFAEEEKHGVWDPWPELTITSPFVDSRVYLGQPSARVDLKPMPQSTFSPSQGLRIWPRKKGS
jgi:hypothetical protein